MDVTTSQIRTIVDVLCRHLESTGRSHLTLRRELYWSVPQGPEPPDAADAARSARLDALATQGIAP